MPSAPFPPQLLQESPGYDMRGGGSAPESRSPAPALIRMTTGGPLTDRQTERDTGMHLVGLSRNWKWRTNFRQVRPPPPTP